MRRFFLLFSILAAFAFGISAAAPAWAQNPSTRPVAPAPPSFTPEEKADLKRVSAYLNTLTNVQGHFLQISHSGASDQGVFYLKKPGRVRFEYEKPNTNLIVADGTSVAVQNVALKTTDRFPLVNSPLRLLLSQNIDLATDPRISLVRTEQGALSVTARETQGPAQGSITLTFADAGSTGGLELRQWEVLDAQGMRTVVIVNEMHRVPDIAPRLFVIEDLSPFKRSQN